jgi:hypothetical protein
MVMYASGAYRNLDCTGANAHNSMEPPQWRFRQTRRLLQLTVRQVRPFPYGMCQRNGARACYPRPRGICTPLVSAQMDVCCLVWGLGVRVKPLSSFGLAILLITVRRRKRGFSGGETRTAKRGSRRSTGKAEGLAPANLTDLPRTPTIVKHPGSVHPLQYCYEGRAVVLHRFPQGGFQNAGPLSPQKK